MSPGLMMFVDKFRLPLLSKVFVNTLVHWLKGKETLVLVNSTYGSLAGPFVAVIVSVVPCKPTFVIRGGLIMKELLAKLARVTALLGAPDNC